MWISGTVIIVVALYLLYHLALGQFGVLFEGYRDGHWWQYFIAVLLLVLGLVFLYAGKVESIVFSKDDATVAKVKTSIICTRQVTEWALDQIVNVRVFKRG